MPQDITATNPQTGETVRWDGKAWNPVPRPLKFESDVVSGMGLDASKIAAAGGAGSQWGEVGKEIAGGTGNWLKSVAKDPYHITDPITGLATNLESALREKNPAKIMGALASIRMAMEAPEKIDNTYPVRTPARWAAGLGKTGEKLAAGKAGTEAVETVMKNKESVSEASEGKLKESGSVMERNADKIKNYRDEDQKVQQENKREMEEVQKIQDQNAAADADVRAQQAQRQQAALEAKKHATDLASGQLQDWRDKARAEGNMKYEDLESPESPNRITGTKPASDIHGAVSNIIKTELKGSERPPAILKKMLDESEPRGTSSRALTEVEKRGSQFAADLIKKGQSAETVRAALPNYGYTSVEIDNIMNTATGSLGSEGPIYDFKKLHGLSSELGYAMRDLHGDELHAAGVLKDKIDGMMDELVNADDSSGGKKAKFSDAQDTWNKYFNTFENYASIDRGGSPIAKALQSYDRITKKLRPDSVMDALGKPNERGEYEAYNLAREQLENFKHLDLRTDILESMKDRLKESREPVVRKQTPPMRSPRLKAPPAPPELEPLPPPGWNKPIEQKPVPGFDPSQWRMNELKRRGEQLLGPSSSPGSKYGLVRNVANRLLAELYNNPEFRKWMAGVK
jgi:hypothetical protein